MIYLLWGRGGEVGQQQQQQGWLLFVSKHDHETRKNKNEKNKKQKKTKKQTFHLLFGADRNGII